MKIKLTDIIEAIEETDQDSEFYLDKETGEIVWVNEMCMENDEWEEITDRLDEHGCYQLPTRYDIRDYDIMVDFIQTLSEEVSYQLSSVINGRGAFRRFKDTLCYLGLEQQWYDFKADAYKKTAIEWCTEHDIEFE